jgi:nucleoside-diphosphate-sugar epimerase
MLRPERDALSIARAREDLGFEPKVDLEDGMPPYVEFVRRTLEESGQLKKR